MYIYLLLNIHITYNVANNNNNYLNLKLNKYYIKFFYIFFIAGYLEVFRFICCLIIGVDHNTSQNIQSNLFNSVTIPWKHLKRVD